MELALMWAVNVAFALAILLLLAYYVLKHRQLDESSRRFLLVGFFFAINELSFFFDPLIYELTKIVFFLVLFYAMVSIMTLNVKAHKKIEQQEKDFEEMKIRLERIRQEVEKHG